ncbi:hypothetical protein [Nocardia sp. NPDC049149]|uniref:hypothetical protein n=1 Tax=Nocardia sp. NPDC049149 TaxID=3364315 RepID=UPI00371D2903
MQIRGARIVVLPCAVTLALLTGCGNDKDTATPTTSSAAPTSAAVRTSAAPTAPPTSSAPTTTRPPALGEVDPAQYREQRGYYFQSPSGMFLCAILDQPIDENAQAGCQGPTTPAPADQKECWAKDPNASGLAVGKRARTLCLTQGVFVGEPSDGGNRGGGRVLPYGASITVGPFTCSSAENGVTCTNDSTGNGFQISREMNRTF